ncbi:heterokaryon incompatibility protein-domain-containing protein, partial [Phaeosphaeriaceae sp. PMI808]
MESLYDPLPARQNPHIRLLTLLPAKSEANPIRCSITPFDLTTAPAFENLSYCWGNVAQKKLIECNKRPFQVTNNLYSALQHLRYKDKERILWIDAICINQEDWNERSAQVVIMRNIYQRAERVLVWLG